MPSRDVIAKHGIVASSQVLATQAGLSILQKGGNAVDAAIATVAVLDIVEPFSTGCGGDAFALIHLPDKKKPISVNGSGRSGSNTTLEELVEKGWTEMPLRGGAPVTVPGALHMWSYLVDNYGALELSDVLQPAIKYAKDGFPVSVHTSELWPLASSILINDYAKSLYSINGRYPNPGEIMRNKDLGDVFESVSRDGIQVFYSGEIAERIVTTIEEYGGFVTLEDMESHKTNETTPISTSYRGVDIFEHPPNGQGFAALIMLNLMENFDSTTFSEMTVSRLHHMIESKKLAYADLQMHNADPDFYKVPLSTLLSKDYASKRSTLIDSNKAMSDYNSGIDPGSETVYLATADGEGRAVSFINSLYRGFGSGLVVPGTGIKLQNRGNLFSLDPEHPNCYAPRKLPFHTIIPGALYRDNEFFGVFGIMGGSHQAQAHAQFVSNIVDCHMSPQAALDYPRFDHNQEKNHVSLENGIPSSIGDELRKLGHTLAEGSNSSFGCGQAILRLEDAWIAGSDYRKDGQAAGF
jgi:gamma-glutamyltranspeptidase/glutathione hydrolase